MFSRTGSLQMKQQVIICLQGYELITAKLFKTGLVLTLGLLSLTPIGCHHIHPGLFSQLLFFSLLVVFQLSPIIISLPLTNIILSNEINTFLFH